MCPKIRIMQNFVLSARVSWLLGTDDGALCFICKETVDNVDHFFVGS